MKEQWKDIIGYEGLYEASNLGRVKSLERYVKHGGLLICRKERILKPFLQRQNKRYLQVRLYKDGSKKLFSVHRLVWEAFNGKIPEGMQINHINEDPSDNRLENLNLMTPKENCNWGEHIKKVSLALKGRDLNPGKKPKTVLQFTIEGEFVREWNSTREAERNGFNHNGVSACCRGLYNKSQGYVWKYKWESERTQ